MRAGDRTAGRDRPRLLRALCGAAIVAFVAASLFGVLLPVYTDEIGWRFQERAGFDGVDKMFNDACGANSLARPPWFMWPARAYSALLNGWFAAPIYVRLSGVGYALAWAVLLALLIRRASRDPQTRASLGAIGFGLLALGNTPLLMVLSRPEQPIVLCAAAAALLALPQTGAPASRGAAWPRSFAVAALAAIALSYHLKALFLLPLFVACALLAARGRGTLAPRLLASAAIMAMIAIAARYWLARLQCPDDAVLRAEYARNSLGATLGEVRGAGDAVALIGRLAGNLGLFEYVMLARPVPHPLSSWLAPGQIDATAARQWGRVLDCAWAAALGLAAIGGAVALWRGWRERRMDERLVGAAALLAAVLGWSATQLVRNFYEAGFALPLLASTVVLALAAGARSRALRAATALLAGLLAVSAMVSVGLMARIWMPSLLRAWGQSGYVAEQPFSLAVARYAPAEARVLAAARACRLPPPERAQGLVIDELSYFPYMRSRLPQHWLGVFGGWKGAIGDPVHYLDRHRSDGILVACGHLPAGLRARARAVGEVCCLAPPGW